MKCDRCGNRVEETAFFCDHCGARLHNRVSSSVNNVTLPGQTNKRSKKNYRKTKPGMTRMFFLICFMVVVTATAILLVLALIIQRVEKAIETTEAMIKNISAEYQDEAGQIPFEFKEIVLDMICEKANEGVQQGNYSFYERNSDCVVLGIPHGGDYVYMFSDPLLDTASLTHIGRTESTYGIGSNAENSSQPSFADFRRRNLVLSSKTSKLFGTDALRITTLQPYYTETRNTHPEESAFPDSAAQSIADNNNLYMFSRFNSADDDERDNQEVSIDSLKTLSDFAVVIWHGHGGYSRKHGSFLGTTAVYQRKYGMDWIKGRIIRSFGGTVAVPAAFFEHYLDNNPNQNAVAYLAACQSGKDDRLANAFLEKGFGCIIANSETISREYNLDMLKAFFDGMSLASSGYLTSGQALAKAQDKCGKVDPFSEFGATPIVFGDPDVRLVRNTKNEMNPPSADGVTENWKNAYTALLMQLLPQSRELYSNDDAICGDGIRMALIDLNFDGVPELLDGYHMDNAYGDEYADVYYVNNNTAVLSATVHMGPLGDNPLWGNKEFMLYHNPETGTMQYVSEGSHGGLSDHGKAIYIWNSDATVFPACMPLFYERGSFDVETLLGYGAEADAIEQDEEACHAYQYRGKYLSSTQYTEYMDLFIAQLQEVEEPLEWFVDGDPYTYQPQASVYPDVIARGGSNDDAAKAIAELLFETYETGLPAEGLGNGTRQSAYELTCWHLDNLLQSSAVQCIGKTYPEICQHFGYAKHFGWVPESTNCFYYEGIGEFYFQDDISDEDWQYLENSGYLEYGRDLCPGDIALQVFPADDVCWAFLSFGAPENSWSLNTDSYAPDTEVVGALHEIDAVMDIQLAEPLYEYSFPYKDYAITIRAGSDGTISKASTIWINKEADYTIP